MEEIKVISVNISEKKGTLKTPVKLIDIGLQGVAGDAHSGVHNREISLLAVESIRKMEPVIKRTLKYGEFAENITTEGFPVHTIYC
jgi:MOSC domain-containing protein YiiM